MSTPAPRSSTCQPGVLYREDLQVVAVPVLGVAYIAFPSIRLCSLVPAVRA